MSRFDLSQFDSLFDQRLQKEISDFAAAYPDTPASAVGFAYYSPTPTLLISLDTEENSIRICDGNPAGAYEDDCGRFAINPHDFEYAQGAYDFDGFPSIYNSPKPWNVVFPNQSQLTLREHHNDNDFTNAIASYLLPRIHSIRNFGSLKRTPTFRVIVYLGYGDLVLCWPHCNPL